MFKRLVPHRFYQFTPFGIDIGSIFEWILGKQLNLCLEQQQFCKSCIILRATMQNSTSSFRVAGDDFGKKMERKRLPISREVLKTAFESTYWLDWNFLLLYYLVALNQGRQYATFEIRVKFAIDINMVIQRHLVQNWEWD